MDEEKCNCNCDCGCDKITFSFEPSKRSAKYSNPFKFEIFISDELHHIAEFHQLCKKFALLMGYNESKVEEYFGKSVYLD